MSHMGALLALLLLCSISTISRRIWIHRSVSDGFPTRFLNQSGVYSSSYEALAFPGAREHACMVYGGGSLWLFGGNGFSELESDGYDQLGDMWQYNLKRNQWRCVDRLPETREPGIPVSYGTSFDIASHPGARSAHTCIYYERKVSSKASDGSTKSETEHSVIVYGGLHQGAFKGDVWEFSPTRRLWRYWDTTGDGATREDVVLASYGEENYRYRSYRPSGRVGHCAARYEDSLVTIGGFGFGTERVTGWLADVWLLNMTVQRWKFLQDGSGSHGVMAVNSRLDEGSEFAGSRDLTGCWVHDDSLFVYSGRAYGARENDLWRLTSLADGASSRDWSFLGPSESRPLRPVGEQTPKHKLTFHPDARPGVREDFATMQRGSLLYLYGGKGRSGRGSYGLLGDLWVLDVATGLWKWVDPAGDGGKTSKKEDFKGRYESQEGDAAISVFPSARVSAVGASAPTRDRLFIFGGRDIDGIRSDLWELGFTCGDVPSEDSENSCSGHGHCVADETCVCDDDEHDGDLCEFDLGLNRQSTEDEL